MRVFGWWFSMGCLMTLSVLMVQGGVRDLIYGAAPLDGGNPFITFAMTIAGGGLMAGCIALIMNRIR